MGLDLVTGGCGFIGSHLVERLLAEGRAVRVLDNLAVGRRANLEAVAGQAALELRIGDVADRDAVGDAMAGVERVFHLAARADIVPSIVEPDAYYSANVDGTYEVLRAARHAGVSRLVYAASSSCYGIPDRYPTAEDAPMRPQYPYALTKRLGEELVLHWAQVYKFPAISLRFFNVYGPRARTSGTYGAVFGVFLAQLLAGEPLTVVGDGEQTRDFTYVEDIVEALFAAAASPISGQAYNVGSDGTVSVNRLVALLEPASVVHIAKRPGEPDCTWADIARIKRDLGWRPKVAFEEGVARLLKDIDQWRDAPVWTEATIADATSDWFRYLGDETGPTGTGEAENPLSKGQTP